MIKMTDDYAKGYLDGYRVILYGHFPKFSCNFDDTEEYTKGWGKGQEDCIKGIRY
jgi:hypothetical protein